MGEWHEVNFNNGSPCRWCLVGWSSLSQKSKNGKLYQKYDSCAENCDRLREFSSIPKEHFLGDNIRDAIAIIKG